MKQLLNKISGVVRPKPITRETMQELLTAVEQYSLSKSEHAKQEIDSWLEKHGLSPYVKDGNISVTYIVAQLEKKCGDELVSLLERYLKQETQDVFDFIQAADYSAVLHQEITRFKLFYFSIHHKKDIDAINAKIIKVLEKHHLNFFEEGGKVRNFEKGESLINKQDIREIIQKKYNDEKLLACLSHGNAADINARLKDLFNLEPIIQEQSITMSNVKEHVRENFYQLYEEIAQIIVGAVHVDKILENILRAQLKSGFNALGITDDFRMQSVTAENIEQHILNNKLKLIQKYITDADSTLQRGANKICTSSNTESLSKIFSSLPKILSVAYSKAINDAGKNADIRLKVMDQYRDFLSEAEHIREISNRVSKEVPNRLDKALYAIVSNKEYQKTILKAAASYAASKLAIDIDVNFNDGNTNKFLVIVKTLSRKSGSKAEHNHTVPVSVFLTALKHMLESKEFSSGSDLLEHVKDFYGQDYQNNPYYRSVKSYIVDISKQEECKEHWTVPLANRIIDSIYQNWNERPYATYVEKREQAQYSAEGAQIKKLNAVLNKLYDDTKKSKIKGDDLDELYDQYFKAIDIKIQNDFVELYHVVKDSIWLARIILKTLQSHYPNSKVLTNYDKNYALFNLLEFGKKLIAAHSSSASETRKQKLQQDWETYVKEQQLSHAHAPSSIYSPQPSHDDICKVHIRYDNASIKKILCEHYSIKKEIYIDIEQLSGAPKMCKEQIDRIKDKLLLDMKLQTAEKFYAIGIKNSLEGMTAAAIIHLLKKDNVFEIYIKPLINYQYSSDLNTQLSEYNEISKFIERFPAKKECLTLIDYKELKIAKITEVFHISINANCDLSSQKEEINKILDQDNSHYELMHHGMISPPGTSHGLASSSMEAYPCKGNKDCTPIPGLPEAFSSYYQDQVAFLLQLRLEDAVPGVLKSVNVLEENYTLRKSNEDYIATKLSSFILSSEKNIILIPLNVVINHLVGIAAVKNGKNVVIHYMDSELNPPPESLFMQISVILKSNDYSMELRRALVEKQKYSNCGPEVIENFIYYFTGKRATQENAVPIHSLLLENSMLDQAIYANQREQNKDIIEYLSHQIVSDKTEDIVDSSNEATVSLAILPQIEHTAFVAIEGSVEPHVFLTSNAIDKSASAVVYDAYWKPAANLFNQLDISWHIKKMIYHADVSRFNQMLKYYNIDSSIDIFKDNSKFKKELLLKVHPDKGGSPEDFVFVSGLKEKFESDLNVYGVAQEFLYNAMTGFKILDTAVASARFMYTPTQDNMKKVLMDSAQIYGLYSGVSFYPTAITALDAAHYFHLGEYKKAAEHIMITACYAVVPHIIGQLGIPYIGLVYGTAITVYSGYNAVSNAYSLYLQVNTDDKLSTQLPYVPDVDDFFIDADYDFPAQISNNILHP